MVGKVSHNWPNSFFIVSLIHLPVRMTITMDYTLYVH